VSIFAKEAIRYIVEKQKKDDTIANDLLKQNDYAHLAEHLKIRMIHVSDNDLQTAAVKNFDKNCLYNTWSPHTLFEEMSAQSDFMAGTNECKYNIPHLENLDEEGRFASHSKRGMEVFCKSYASTGNFTGCVVQHDEVVSIQKYLTTYDKNGKIKYAPTTLFVYSPSKIAADFMFDVERHNRVQPKKTKVLYEELTGGTEHVGIFVLGETFNPVWVGNSVSLPNARRFGHVNTPTILQVSTGVLAGLCWVLENKDKRGIFYPEDLDANYVLRIIEKYMDKTEYITINKDQYDAPIYYPYIRYADIVHFVD
jgi:homospermidine synthase